MTANRKLAAPALQPPAVPLEIVGRMPLSMEQTGVNVAVSEVGLRKAGFNH
jgi:hypothetical protein